MKVDPLKVAAVTVSPSLLTVLGIEKGKEGVSFAQTLESVVGQLGKTAIGTEPEEQRETSGEASTTCSPDYDLQMILQAELAAGGVNPKVAGPCTQAIATQDHNTASNRVELETKTIAPRFDSMPTTLQPEGTTISYNAEPVFVPPEWRRTALLPVDTILPPGLAPSPHTKLPLPQVTPASVKLPSAPEVVLQPKVAEQATFSAPAKSETITPPAEPTPSALHPGFVPQLGAPQLVAEQVPIARGEVPSSPEVALQPKVAEQANFSAVANSEPLPLTAAQFVATPLKDYVAQPSAEAPVVEYVAPAPVVPGREGFRLTRPAGQAAPDTNTADLSGTTANTSAPTMLIPKEVVAPAFVQRLNVEIISFAAHPTRPELTMEITPPEYGKVIVSAEREVGGQVVVRLVAETQQAKTALLEHLPRSTATLEVRVYTPEEYREYRDERHREPNREPNRERKEQPERQGRRENRVEFKI